MAFNLSRDPTPPVSFAIGVASAALSLTATAVGVRFIERMTSTAMRHAEKALSSTLRAVPTSQVFSLCDWLQVLGIDASGDSTQVVEYESVTDRTAEQFVSEPMREHRLGFDAKATVSKTIARARPQPTARCFLNFRHEPIV